MDLYCSCASSLVLGSSPVSPEGALGHCKLYLGLLMDLVCSDLAELCLLLRMVFVLGSSWFPFP